MITLQKWQQLVFDIFRTHERGNDFDTMNGVYSDRDFIVFHLLFEQVEGVDLIVHLGKFQGPIRRE